MVRFYNYKTLRQDLIAKGHVFRNNSDTEVLVHGYEEYGTEVCRGMFAFMIYDANKDIAFGATIISVLSHFITALSMVIWFLVLKSNSGIPGI